MSITGALSNALSGLGASTRAAETVSSNVANALTEGYGRRSVDLASRTTGSSGGVQVVAVERHVSQTLIDDRRGAMAGLAGTNARTAFLEQLNDSYGLPGSGTSLADRLSAVNAALVSASARPESAARLATAVDGLRALATQVNQVQSDIQTARGRADAAIATDVAKLNDTLKRIELVNLDIRRLGQDGSTGAAASLLDERQRLVDQVAEIVPVREIPRGDGSIALMTPRGVTLLDSKAAVLEFKRANVMTPDLDFAAGTLSGITVNGREIDLARADHALSGGSLAGHLEVRDRLAPGAQAELDAFARDLVERFQDPTADPTLSPGDPALLTDAGAVFVPGSDVGLAGRLALNGAVDPDAGGELWRLRDGLGAGAPGDAGQGAQLTRLGDALSALRTVSAGAQAGLQRDATTLLSGVMSGAGSALVLAEADSARTGARAEILTSRLFSEGVDTDEEMQMLLRIEQAYAANARVIETVESMLDALMRI